MDNGQWMSRIIYYFQTIKSIIIMNKVLFLAASLFVCLLGGASASANPMDLDAAIKEAAVKMGTKLPAKTEVALVSVASSSAQFSEYVISRLEAALVDDGKLIVLDRANLDKVRDEQGFQLSGEVDDKSAKDIGKILGAGAIVTGSFINLGDMYGLSLKAINMKTAAIAVSYPADIAKSSRIETLLASGGSAGTGGTRTAQAPRASGNTTQAVPSASKTYKVGDKGPAGGIVFYDKFNYADGWRYLEVAPEETEQVMEWGTRGKQAGGTQTGIGAGKRNTPNIANFLAKAGEVGRAAQFCDLLEYGGYEDWFLPSKDELNMMYQNLKQKNLGGFSNANYWSSSESDSYDSYSQGFGNYGSQDNRTKSNTCRVRAIRQF
ncbi:hypothetical protein FACS189467_2740 [Bacteroidia bacterium]|nr:hypothetical protein FACS189467_2740 [Bacteroidia bacterium]